ncbi:MAG: RNA pseudouridine synthase [Treponema sp.]|jgi:23S rRNA pseudouridine1911/1915/1917 synthase|nr:RNA pseudouridine synthase [Treponema sp.]
MAHNILSRILYISPRCLVINKLPGEAVEGAGAGMEDLPRLLARSLEQTETPHPEESLALPLAVHRLDVPVTGCALFARTRRALAFLNAAFAGKNAAPGIEKRYWAVTEQPRSGLVIPESGELVHWLFFDKRKNKSFAYNEPGPGRKKAALRYHLAGFGRNYLFFEIELASGRHHQIRAQFAASGLYVKGDLKYGAKRSEKNGGIRLHARSLSFFDPGDTGKKITLQAAPPEDNLWLAFPGNGGTG